MSISPTDSFAVINPTPEHFVEIQELCRKVYPFSKPWSLDQLEAHHSYFPDGQLIVVDQNTNKVLGLAFSLIISWDDYSPQDNWQDFTSGGFFHNHNPRKGKTLYGAEVMVDPECRGRGLGKMLYKGRQEIARKYKLKRIRAGARLRGYGKFKDKMSPEEYTRQVIAKKIFDPTLSFQLSQGFVALDVAKNYLFNDPESLGYAAVIEWLNPEVATEKDFKKQQDTVATFMADQKLVVEYLPRELRRLVRKITILLGQTIREYEGDQFYDRIEYYRQQLKKARVAKSEKHLAALYKKINSETKAHQFKIAHSFSLLLELVNICESAYRTWRQRQKPLYRSLASKAELNFVLTAHPTEARSKPVVELVQLLTHLLVDGLHNNFVFKDAEICSHLRMLWLHPLVKTKPPSVIDEADYIYSIIFAQPLFDFILANKDSYELKLRSWVGGDKDGHPGVTHQVMNSCLQRSRQKLIKIIGGKLNVVLGDLEKLRAIGHKRDEEIKRVKQLTNSLYSLNQLRTGDGKRVVEWRKSYMAFLKKGGQLVAHHHELSLIGRAFELFPALVMPIELREDAGEILTALNKKSAPIRLMLLELKRIAGSESITSYARGLVVSHCESAQDIEHAGQLIFQCSRSRDLPVVPLFESREALKGARTIVKEWLKRPGNLQQVQKNWNERFEVMLGYSDSAKQIGVLPSRLLIRNSMFQLEKTLKKLKVKPIFFHGSGGSVARGGGSLREQILWWPNSAIQMPKLTVQGEMIQRIFATKEILNSQCLHLSNRAQLGKSKKLKIEPSTALDKFAQLIENTYIEFISDSQLLPFCLEATPYHYLKVLKIGSRPAKRATDVPSLSSLRAIPWVLCWTQTRLLLPTWLGVGQAWARLTKAEQSEMQELYVRDPFFSSFVKAQGFTLAKVELGIWNKYLTERHGKKAEKVSEQFASEYQKALKFVKDVSGSKQLISHKPWLEESIKLRSPYIHILNLLQIAAMKNNDERLLKETLVGIACGMLTTG